MHVKHTFIVVKDGDDMCKNKVMEMIGILDMIQREEKIMGV